MTRVVNRIRNRVWSAAFLDGVNALAALMVGVTVQLGRAALIDLLTVALAVVALVLQWRTRINTAWYIGAAALVGLARMLLT